MLDTVQAIPTWYAGCHFRSRREARWAVFFSALGIPWEYEPQGYNLNGTPYLPDFLITPQTGDPAFSRNDPNPYWFEVKGQPPTPEETKKAADLSTATDLKCFIYFEQPQITTATTAVHFLPGAGEGLTGPWLWSDCICYYQPQIDLYGGHWCAALDRPSNPINTSVLQYAFQEARAARFGS